MTETLTSSTFFQFKYLSDPKLSQDGQSLAFIVKCVNPEKTGYSSDLYLYENGASRPVTDSGAVSSYAWTPEGDILFLSGAGERSLRRISMKDGNTLNVLELPFAPKQITALEGGKFAILGKYDNGTSRPEDESNATVTTLTEVPFWGEFGAGYTSGVRSRLYLYDSRTNDCTPITSPWFEVIQYLYGDGKISWIGMEYDSTATRMYSLWACDISTGTVKELIPQNTMYIFGCAPFGDEIMFMGNESTPYGNERWDNNFYKISAEGGSFRLVKNYQYNVGGGNGTTDAKMGGGQNYKRAGDRLYLLSTQMDSIGLYSIGPEGGWREENTRQGLILSFDKAGSREIVCAMYGEKLAELYENGRQITHFNDELQSRLQLSTPVYEEVETWDGYQVHGWILKPFGYEPGKQYPAILHIHGGPQTIFSDVFHYEQELWASRGYFVLFCNPRGSDGRGFDFRNITAKYGDWDYKSLMNWMDGVLSRYPEIDRKRLGVTGGSYGGYMTNWIITQTNRFAAAVSQRSISNWITFEYTAIRGWWLSVDKHGARAGENSQLLWDASPLQYAGHCTTPTLFIHSDNDHVCWMSEGLTMFSALKSAGCPTKICIFHGEDHELSRAGKPANRIRRMDEILEWFDRYLNPPRGAVHASTISSISSSPRGPSINPKNPNSCRPT